MVWYSGCLDCVILSWYCCWFKGLWSVESLGRGRCEPFELSCRASPGLGVIQRSPSVSLMGKGGAPVPAQNNMLRLRVFGMVSEMVALQTVLIHFGHFEQAGSN